MGRLTYKEIAKAKIKEQRNVVVSETYNSNNQFLGYSISEQLVTEENGKETKVFLKNGLGIVDKEGLRNLSKAIIDAYNISDNEEKDVDTENKMC